MLFADSIVAVISQRLLPKIGGSGRAAAVEIIRASLYIKDLIKDEQGMSKLKEALIDGRENGMIPFDDHLAQLYREGQLNPQQSATRLLPLAGFARATNDPKD